MYNISNKLTIMVNTDNGYVQKLVQEIASSFLIQHNVVFFSFDCEKTICTFQSAQPDIIVAAIGKRHQVELETLLHIRQINDSVQYIITTEQEDFNIALVCVELQAVALLPIKNATKQQLSAAMSRAINAVRRKAALDYLLMCQSIRIYLTGGDLPEIRPGLLDGSKILFVCSSFVPSKSLLYMDNYEYCCKLQEHFYNYGKILSIVINPNHCVLLVSTSESRSEQILHQQAWEFAQAFQRYQMNYQFDAHIALGGLCTNDEQLREAYLRARSLILDGVFNDGPSIIFSSPSTNIKYGVQRARDLLNDMEKLVCNEQYAEAQQPARMLMDLLVKSRSPQLFQEVMLRAEFLLASRVLDCKLVYPYNRMEQAQNALLDTLNQLEEAQVVHYSKKVRKMIAYAHKAYRGNASLSHIAQQLNVTPVYAGQLFKKEVGKTFAAYVKEYRIKHALELLSTGKYKIYEISNMVGYQSVYYFSKAFKNVTGKKPSDFLGKSFIQLNAKNFSICGTTEEPNLFEGKNRAQRNNVDITLLPLCDVTTD